MLCLAVGASTIVWMSKLGGPRESTIRKLFALSSNVCAFPDCQTAIVDSVTGTILGEVCHICAQNEGGPRFDPGQTSKARHSLENLVLMCGVHHKIIDADENLSVYSVEHLLGIKAKHESGAQRQKLGGVSLSGETVAALLETVRTAVGPTTHMDFRGALFNAGGLGGGPGGAGGGGGVIHIVGVTPAGFRHKIEVDAHPSTSPGGGGGGGGVKVFSGRLVSAGDLKSGLVVSAFFFANAVEVANGLLYVMGGGWENFAIAASSREARIMLACVIDTGRVLPSTRLALAIVVQAPSGEVVASESFDLDVGETSRPIMRQCLVRMIAFRVAEPGVWKFTLRSGDLALAGAPLEIKLRD